ncbi:MAG: tetratricopeptide repeat protein [Candidatus Omnitrophica bacterium]|nr:tetratricopeptide repeat protein [Candidatus Omnitrophota bacterium]MCM8791138.1 tetratricopeptide repeat protein [Candidatus Omnitrophota bacterium]
MERKDILKAALIIFLLSLVVYSNSLGGQFVYDDGYFIVKNIHIRNLANIRYFFTNPSAVAFSELSRDVYRPLSAISYAVDYHFWKLDTFGYHAVNILMHAANAVLLFLLLVLILGNIITAFLASLLFAFHPVQTEVVAWISGRSSILFLFFYLLTFIFYITYLRRRRIVYVMLSYACCIASLFSKEMAVSLPMLIAAYDVHFRDNEPLRKKIPRWIPYFMLTAFFVATRYFILNRVSQCEWWGGTPYRTFLTMLSVLPEYARLLVWPVRLCAFYVTPIKVSIADIGVIIPLIVMIAIIIAMPFVFMRFRKISFFICWLFITFIPVSNIVPLRALMAERFLYLPSIGFCVLVAMAFAALIVTRPGRAVSGARPGHAGKRKVVGVVAAVLAGALLAFYGGRTMMRNEDWKDSLTITRSILKVDPRNPWALMSLGVGYSAEGQFDKAIEPLKKVIAMSDTYFAPKNILGFCYLQLGRFQDAVDILEQAVRIKPDNLEALSSLGVAYANLGNYEKAVRQFEKAISIDRSFVEAYINLGTVYDRVGRYERAIEEYKRVEQNTTSRQDIAVSYIRIGDIYNKLDMTDKAKEYYRNAIDMCDRSMYELKKIAEHRLNARWELER